MKTSNVIVGVLAGAAVGAILGVLFAPDKGSNTRKKISQKTQDYTKDVKDQVHHMAEAISAPFRTASNEANGLVDATRAKVAESRK